MQMPPFWYIKLQKVHSWFSLKWWIMLAFGYSWWPTRYRF